MNPVIKENDKIINTKIDDISKSLDILKEATIRMNTEITSHTEILDHISKTKFGENKETNKITKKKSQGSYDEYGNDKKNIINKIKSLTEKLKKIN